MSTRAHDTYPFDDDPTPRSWPRPIGTFEGLADGAQHHRPDAPPARTEGQRRRARRNLCIAICHRVGASQRMLAEVFDLPRSRIAEILQEING